MLRRKSIMSTLAACSFVTLGLIAPQSASANKWHYQIVRNLYPLWSATPLTLSPDGAFVGGAVTNLEPGRFAGVQISLTGEKTSIKHDFAATDVPVSRSLLSQTGNVFGVAARTGDQAGTTVFEISPEGTYQTLYASGDGASGYIQRAPLSKDSAGNLYGTADSAGTNHAGTVFKITPTGTVTVLHQFGSGQDGAYPASGVIADKHGNLYGTTASGGANNFGTVFKIARDGSETVLLSFQGRADGAAPIAGLVRDRDGNLYGTTSAFGMGDGGTVFKLAPDGTETVLHSLDIENEGYLVISPLVRDNAGNLYGTASRGGQGWPAQVGAVFEVSQDGTYTTLHFFSGSHNNDGEEPDSGVVFDADGNLYGTTLYGGSGPTNQGVLYELSRGR